MKLWKNNRTDQEWELSAEEIAERFWKWDEQFPDSVWPLERSLRYFITTQESEGGLSSVFDEGREFAEVFDAVRNYQAKREGPANV